MRPADGPLQGQFAGAPREPAAAAAAAGTPFPRARSCRFGRGGQNVEERARTVQPAAAVAAGDPRGEPEDADATTAQSAVPPQPQVPIEAHEVRPERPGAHVGRGGERTVAGEPVQLQRLRLEEHHF